MTIQGKIRKCAKTVLYWAKKRDIEPFAAYCIDYFHKAMVGHLAYIEAKGISLPQDVVVLVKRAKGAMG